MESALSSTEPTYVIGCDADENTKLVQDSSPMDVWFHVSGLASAHLVYRNTDGATLKQLRKSGVIYKMALKLKISSKYKKMPNIEVDYTFIKDVSTTDIPGRVTLSRSKVMKV